MKILKRFKVPTGDILVLSGTVPLCKFEEIT